MKTERLTASRDAAADEAHHHVNGLVEAIVDIVVERVMKELRAELPPHHEAGLMKVRRAAAWLEVHPDHVYKLIQAGELRGYPFPDPNSHMHVEVDSLRELLARYRDSQRA